MSELLLLGIFASPPLNASWSWGFLMKVKKMLLKRSFLITVREVDE